MFVSITIEPDGQFRAEVGATEVRVSWPDKEQRVTKSLGFNFVAPTIEEAINGLAQLYHRFMFAPHMEKVNAFNQSNRRLTDAGG